LKDSFQNDYQTTEKAEVDFSLDDEIIKAVQ